MQPGDGGRPASVTALENFSSLSGRGARRSIAIGGGTALLLDESYNANAASMRAALAVLRAAAGAAAVSRCSATCWNSATPGRPSTPRWRRMLTAAADLLFTCGPLMRRLFDAVPHHDARRPCRRLRGPRAARRARRSRPGDAILVKGSLGSRMRRRGRLDALDRRIAGAAA